MKLVTPVILVLAVSLAGTPLSANACDSEPQLADFAKCVACHTAKADASHLSGPNLWGVIGRKAGTAPGYAYSPVLRDSGLTWTTDTLRTYLANPTAMLPGTRMMIAPIKNEQELERIVCYLESLKD